MPIKIGDIVKIKTGTTEMTVVNINGGDAVCHYCDPEKYGNPTTRAFPLAALVKV